jgi:thioredoxin-dependent peroxiredoxin
MVKTMTLKVGDRAPDFTLLNQDGEKVSLKDFKGQNVLVYFYPKAMTPGCTTQACELRDSKKALSKNDIVVLGISADAPTKLKKFQERDKLNFSLLSDEDHHVTEAYGAWGLKKFMGKEYMGIMRQSFLVDPKGKISFIMSKVNTKTHHDDVLEAFKSLE